MKSCINNYKHNKKWVKLVTDVTDGNRRSDVDTRFSAEETSLIFIYVKHHLLNTTVPLRMPLGCYVLVMEL